MQLTSSQTSNKTLTKRMKCCYYCKMRFFYVTSRKIRAFSVRVQVFMTVMMVAEIYFPLFRFNFKRIHGKLRLLLQPYHRKVKSDFICCSEIQGFYGELTNFFISSCKQWSKTISEAIEFSTRPSRNRTRGLLSARRARLLLGYRPVT